MHDSCRMTFRRFHLKAVEVRKILILSCIFYMMYLIQDFYLFRSYFPAILKIRLGIVFPVMAGFVALTFTPIYYRLAVLTFSGVTVISAAGIIYIEYLVRESSYAGLYFYGLAQVLIVFLGSGKMRLVPAGIIGTVIVTAGVWVDSTFGETDPYIIVTKSVFMYGILFLGMIVSGIVQFNARDRFSKQRELHEKTITDPLTGLKNRYFFETVLEDEISQFINMPEGSKNLIKRGTDLIESSCYSLILLDIDHFKKINDTYGHITGDVFLKDFAERVRRNIRSGDVFVRWGGEEFLLILRFTDSSSTEALIAKFREEISGKPFYLDGVLRRVTVSGGYAVLEHAMFNEDVSFYKVFGAVDSALYESKRNGRNRFTRADIGSLSREAVKS